MQFRKSACIALSLLSVNTFAMNDGVKIISEKLTKSSNFHGSIYSIGAGQANGTRSSTASVRVTAKSGWVGTTVRVDGNHTISITNRGSGNNRYTYHYELRCADAFANYQRTIELKPGANFNDQAYSFTEVTKNQPGNFKIEGQTRIEGAEMVTARDESNLNIHK